VICSDLMGSPLEIFQIEYNGRIYVNSDFISPFITENGDESEYVKFRLLTALIS
jgi:hypothetical protein